MLPVSYLPPITAYFCECRHSYRQPRPTIYASGWLLHRRRLAILPAGRLQRCCRASRVSRRAMIGFASGHATRDDERAATTAASATSDSFRPTLGFRPPVIAGPPFIFELMMMLSRDGEMAMLPRYDARPQPPFCLPASPADSRALSPGASVLAAPMSRGQHGRPRNPAPLHTSVGVFAPIFFAPRQFGER